jgi:hypothetical protein
MKQFNFIILLLMIVSANSFAQTDNNGFVVHRGKVTDRSGNSPLTYANVLVNGTNIATVTNTEGEFSIKLPAGHPDYTLNVRFLGFKNKEVKISDLASLKGLIQLEQASYQLPQIDVMIGDATAIVKAMFDRVDKNYPEQDMFMTAFYRESILKNRTYVSLSEAVVDVQKEPYSSYKSDAARLFKTRKQTDYNKLDTLVFKLMGGPYNNLYLDVIKNPAIIFTENVFEKYYFTFDKIDWLDERIMYVVKFNPYPQKDEALYSGRLYIDAESYALKSAVFDMSFQNEEEAVRMLIRKKPLNAKVTPLVASYRMDYIEKDGKWYYAYSRIELGMKINWKRKLFNTNYYAHIEMAVTDREKSSENRAIRFRDRLRSDVVISETAEGFSDPEFWGEHNVIEPDKPIEAAIRKIQKQLGD